MKIFDVVRVVALASAGLTFALAIANLVVSFLVLRPKKITWRSCWGSGSGFLWLHILAVVIGFQGFVAWGVHEVYIRINEPVTFRPWLLWFLCSDLIVGYFIIFRIELARLRQSQSGLPVVVVADERN